MSQNESLKKAFEQIESQDTFEKVFKSSFNKFLPSTRRLIVIIFIAMIMFSLISYINIGLKEIINVVDSTNTIILALLALTVTGYAIFQSLSSYETLLVLFIAEDKKDKICLFLKYQQNFFYLSIIYIAIIILNFIIIFISKNIIEHLSVYTSLTTLYTSSIPPYITNYSIDILLCIYFAIILNSIIELKSFVYGLYQAIAISSISRVLKNTIANNNKRISIKPENISRTPVSENPFVD